MRERNRILMLLENTPYLKDSRVLAEAQKLTKAGYLVNIVCPTWEKEPIFEDVNGVQVVRYPAPPERDGLLGFVVEYSYALIVTFFISVYLFFQRGFDVIHSHNPPDLFVFIALFYKPFGKLFVFDHHDLSPEVYVARSRKGGNRLILRLLIAVEKLSLKIADRVIATNQSYQRIEVNRGHIPEEKVTIVRNAPDLNRLKPVAPLPELHQKAGTLIGYVGEMGYQDGIDYLLRALYHLKMGLGQTDFYCILLGKGSEVESLKQLSSDLGLDNHVWFYGWANGEQISQVLSTVDICVDPDPSNPFNDNSTMIKMAEYMTFGKPIVAFDLPENRHTAQDAAIYVDNNDELHFAYALKLLMNDEPLRQSMGEYGKQRVHSTLMCPISVPLSNRGIGVYG